MHNQLLACLVSAVETGPNGYVAGNAPYCYVPEVRVCRILILDVNTEKRDRGRERERERDRDIDIYAYM